MTRQRMGDPSAAFLRLIGYEWLQRLKPRHGFDIVETVYSGFKYRKNRTIEYKQSIKIGANQEWIVLQSFWQQVKGRA